MFSWYRLERYGWYHLERYDGTAWCAAMVPLTPIQWYRLLRYDGTASPILSGYAIILEKDRKGIDVNPIQIES